MVLGEMYSLPIIDHAATCAATLDCYTVIRTYRVSSAEAVALSKAGADNWGSPPAKNYGPMCYRPVVISVRRLISLPRSPVYARR